MFQLFGYQELSCENYIILSQSIKEILKVTIYYTSLTIIPLIFFCEVGKLTNAKF